MKTVITHFDGDPFILSFWLRLYDKYWRGETDTIDLSICYNPDKLPQEVINYNIEQLKKYKEIALFIQLWSRKAQCLKTKPENIR